MSSAQDRLILIACIVVESVWFYVLIAVLSLALLNGEHAVTWIAAVAMMGGSFVVARTTLMIIMPLWMQYTIQMGAGVIVIYLMLGTYIHVSSAPGVDLGWLSAVMSDEATTNDRTRAVISTLCAALLWWRGGRIASIEFPTDHLSMTFRVGLIALSIGAIVDISHPANLHIFPLMFTFFAAGLVGLSIGHILPTSSSRRGQQRWTRIIGGVVGAIILIGLAFSILQKSFIDFVATPLGALFNLLVTVFMYVVVLPIAYVVGYIVLWLFGMLQRLLGEPPEQQAQEFDPGSFINEMRERAESSEPSIWGDVIEWAVVVILLMFALALLAWGFRRIVRWRRVDEDGEREPIAEEVDPGLDMARLLFNLLPERFRRRSGATGLRLPDDEQ
ncbi:MAG: hypothetical protein OXC95_03000, partial [Dehalococcoidia bacterium]|nr:hypothetical protein [Dehalococcoidia bacterium]